MPKPMQYAVFWENIYAKCWDLANRMHNKQPDLIIGMGRGGLIPAVVLSHRMKVPMEPIMWQTRDGQYRNPTMLALILERHAYNDGQHILIVDDINDTGRALLDLTKLLEEHVQKNNSDYTYETAVLFERNTSAFKADYVAETLTDDRWITFPWEE